MQETIAWFDTETTGVDPEKDRLIQVAVVITDMELNVVTEVIVAYINPGIPIPQASIDTHGITDEIVSKSPPFAEIAPGLLEFIKNSHPAGYNVVFDIRVLQAEFSRVGLSYEVSGKKIIDPLDVLRKLEPRDQPTVYAKYTGEVLENAHDAKADILATLRIAQEQLKQHSDRLKSVDDMHTITEPENRCDLAKKIVMKEGVPVFNMGPHFGKPISEEMGFLRWMLGKDFPVDTKNWIERYLEEYGRSQ